MKLKASTLIETLLAMLIIVICLGIATMTYVNVLNSGKQRSELRAQLLLEAEAARVKQEGLFIDTEKEMNEGRLEYTFQPYGESNNLYLFSLILRDREAEIISSRRELMILDK